MIKHETYVNFSHIAANFMYRLWPTRKILSRKKTLICSLGLSLMRGLMSLPRLYAGYNVIIVAGNSSITHYIVYKDPHIQMTR